ncbi:MAG TPA: SDR family NAD(P)-dependent oxidoreductase [Candidatus Baltobacteraceae bacterium]|jgi:short-subunit dehydrogenase|nr:SDR family NAD(P)-dependent oxidoreductase [Candidatus Baltobacteraceae bacterium]
MPERKVLVITGASSGIGRALALRAASMGHAVIAVSRERAELEHVCHEIVDDGGTCVPVVTDVTQADAPARIVTAAQTRFGRIDVIVNLAGAATSGLLLEQTDAQIDGQWQLHVAAPLRITRAAFPLLRESGGQVMFVGSGLRRVPAPYYGAYCAAKAAVETLAQQLRRELLGTGVAVTFVDPGSVRTNFAKNAGIPAYGPSWVPVDPDVVAKRIMGAIERRPWRLLAVPWHTLGAILGEWFPHAADKGVTPPMPASHSHAEASPSHAEVSKHPEESKGIEESKGPAISSHAEVSKHPEESKGTEESHGTTNGAPTFHSALEPIARRLERVRLSPEFLASLLQPGSDVHLSEAAMRWAGMPNKNERAAMAEALDALTAGGFLERTGEESWRVVRSAQ